MDRPVAFRSRRVGELAHPQPDVLRGLLATAATFICHLDGCLSVGLFGVSLPRFEVNDTPEVLKRSLKCEAI